jgi:cell division protein FtsL
MRIGIDGPFIDLYKTKNFFITIIMSIVVIISGLATVYSKYKTRMLHVQLQRMYTQRSNLNTEWSKLLLEKSTWMSDDRIEQLARKNLNMVNPDQVYIIGQ